MASAVCATRPRCAGACGCVAVGYVFLLVAWPVSLVVKYTFADGLGALSRTRSPTPTSRTRCS